MFKRIHSVRRLQHWSIAAGTVALTIGLSMAPSPAQEGAEPTQSPFPLIGSGLVESLNLSPSLTYQTDYIYLDGRPLFLVTAPVAGDDGPTDDPLLAERIRSIQRNLRQIAENSNPDTLDVQISTDPDTQSPVIEFDGRYLMTVTDIDAQVQGLDPQVWARVVARRVREALIAYHQERQTQFLIRQALIAAGLLAGMWALSRVLNRWERRLQSRRETLQTQIAPPPVAENEDAAETIAPVDRDPHVLQDTHKQLVWLDMQHRLIQVGRLAIWIGGSVTILRLFPYTRWIYSFHSLFIRSRILVLLGVSAGTYVAIKLSNLSIHSLFSTIQRGKWLSALQQQSPTNSRMIKRLDTLEGVVRGTGAVLLSSIGLLIGIGLMGVNIGPVLTSLGVIGLGISLAAQDLIKDLINGMLILLEDQFAEGDVIVVDGRGGLVERINLRITQLRNTEGTLITMPNSTIRVVENLSNGWARVDLMIRVAYDTNIDQAMRVIESVAVHMSRDWQWKKRIIEPPQMLGVDDLGDQGVTLRIWIKVQPLAQWEVAREFRRRLKIAFDQNNIRIPFPQQDIWFRNRLEAKDHGLSQEDSQALLEMVSDRTRSLRSQSQAMAES